jgi:putative membrane protein
MPYCGGFGFWWIFPIIFGGLWLLLIGTAVWRFGWFARRSRWGRSEASDVLRERFARGDIDADEFQRRLNTLQGS